MFRERLRASLGSIGEALREPEAFALRWHRGGSPYSAWVFAALALTAIAGTTTYGMIMGLLGGPGRMFACGLYCTVAAGIGWSLPLPALYILNSAGGSRLRASTTFLAALVTTSWGGLAMIASIPIAWFFTAALPTEMTLFAVPLRLEVMVLVVHAVVFLGVSVAMMDVFSRVMAALEPEHTRPLWWLLLVGAISGELIYAFDLLQFKTLAWF